MPLPTDIIAYLETLTVTQGQGVGGPFPVLPWQRKFINGAFRPTVETGALSVPRGDGKTALLAGIGAAAIAGPLAVERGEVVLVASSFEQALIAFRHSRAFLDPIIHGGKRGQRWVIRESQNAAVLVNPANGASLTVRGSDPKRLHGLAPVLVLADEPAQWPPNVANAMLAALETSLGKQPNARMIALGTQSADSGHWFQSWLAGDCDFALLYAAGSEDDPLAESTWRKANPSYRHFPNLRKAIRQGADRAARNDAAMASFKALRLNMGTSDTLRSELLTAEQWRACESDDLPPRSGPLVYGIDLGSGAAMSAVAAYWPLTGRLEVLAAFPEIPDLYQRGQADAVGELYCQMQQRGELVTCGPRVTDVTELLQIAVDRFGYPAALVADRWRESELRQALDRARMPQAALIVRGQGFKDGGEDVRDFRKAAIDGRVQTPESLLMRSAMGGAVTISDPAGNSKLAKAKDTPERRDGHKDDAVAATILAVAVGFRNTNNEVQAVVADSGYTLV